eukprot:403373523
MKVAKQKKGDKVSLNPQCLKDLYKLIMAELSPNERASVAIYELQTFLIEQAVKPKEDWNNMNFEMFINFMMSYIRLEPNLWIKSSEVHQAIINKLRDQFGDSLGAPIPSGQVYQPNNPTGGQSGLLQGGLNTGIGNQGSNTLISTAVVGNPSNAPMDVNQQKIMKQNQNAIASYKKYIEDTAPLRQQLKYEANQNYSNHHLHLASLIASNSANNEGLEVNGNASSNPNETKSDSRAVSAGNEEKGSKNFSQIAIPEEVKIIEEVEEELIGLNELEGVQDGTIVADQQDIESSAQLEEKSEDLAEKIKQQVLQKRALNIKPTYKIHSVNFYRRGQTLDIKLLPFLFQFYMLQIEQGCQLQLTESQKYLLQNFIMFLAFKEKKNKKRSRMMFAQGNKYSILATSGHDLYYEDELEINKFPLRRELNQKFYESFHSNVRLWRQWSRLKFEKGAKEDIMANYHSDTSLSSIVNDDNDYSAKIREVNTKYNLRQRTMFSMRFDEPDEYYPSTSLSQAAITHHQSISKYGAMNSSAVKRNSKQLKNQLEIRRIKDKANEKLVQHETFQQFMEYLRDQTGENEEIKQQQQVEESIVQLKEQFQETHLLLKELFRFKFSDRVILSNVMMVIDEYVSQLGWSQVCPREEYTLFEVTKSLNKLRKTVFTRDTEDIKTIVSGYLFHFQNRLLIQNKGKVGLKYITKCMKKSSQNMQLLTNSHLSQDEIKQKLNIQGTPWTLEQVNQVLQTYKKQQEDLHREDDEEENDINSQENANMESPYLPKESNNGIEGNNESPLRQQQKRFVKKWSENDQKKFYEAVELFKDSQLGNKKIAKYMGEHIDPIQIRHEKIRYQKEKRKQEKQHMMQKINDAQNVMHEADWVMDSNQSGVQPAGFASNLGGIYTGNYQD